MKIQPRRKRAVNGSSMKLRFEIWRNFVHEQENTMKSKVPEKPVKMCPKCSSATNVVTDMTEGSLICTKCGLEVSNRIFIEDLGLEERENFSVTLPESDQTKKRERCKFKEGARSTKWHKSKLLAFARSDLRAKGLNERELDVAMYMFEIYSKNNDVVYGLSNVLHACMSNAQRYLGQRTCTSMDLAFPCAKCSNTFSCSKDLRLHRCPAVDSSVSSPEPYLPSFESNDSSSNKSLVSKPFSSKLANIEETTTKPTELSIFARRLKSLDNIMQFAKPR